MRCHYVQGTGQSWAEVSHGPGPWGYHQCDDVLTFRGHSLSELSFLSENRHRAVHTGRLRAATVAHMVRSRMRFRLRDSPQP
jgi:hypothetical protein